MQKYQSIYDRFGYQLDEQKVHKAFCDFVINEFWINLYLIINPKECKSERIEIIDSISDDIFRKFCRATYENPSEYSSYEKVYSLKKVRKLINVVYKYQKGRMREYFVFLQILIDIIYSYKDVRYMLNDYIQKLDEYFSDFPLLGVKIKTYKTQAPKILPVISKSIDQKISNTLNTLENNQFTKTITQFEDGLKQFLTANDPLTLKNVIEDMRGSCDEVIKEVLNDKKKGMKSIFGEPQYTDFGLTTRSKKIFEVFMDWMDDLKHGSSDDITKHNVVMIIGMTADFIQFVSSNYNPKK